jgi:hypothetical protein
VRDGRGAEHAVRRPVHRRDGSHGAGDRRLGPHEIGTRSGRREPQEVAVAVRVDADGVAGGDDLAREARAAPDLLADEEERRDGACLAQDLEHPRRALRVRSVVEGERDRGRVADAIAHAEEPAGRRADGAQCGRGMDGADRRRAERRACEVMPAQ